MREGPVVRSYAETLFELALRHEGPERYGELIEEVARLVDELPGFRRFLETPQVDDGEKKALLARAFEDRVPDPFLRFLLVVVEKRRQRLLRQIAAGYRRILDEHLGRIHVQATLAREPDEALRRELDERLSALLGRTAVTHVRVKPEILGGVVLRAGDRIFDGSIRRRLESLRRHLAGGRVAGDGRRRP